MSLVNWEPFIVSPPDAKLPPMRPMATVEGLGDRLRTAAFAEFQAFEAFSWAASHYTQAAAELRQVWRRLAQDERRHRDMILARMEELGVGAADKPVSDRLWLALKSCASSAEFSFFMARSEERGRTAELRFHELLSKTDPITAELFRRIAADEAEHIALASNQFLATPKQKS